MTITESRRHASIIRSGIMKTLEEAQEVINNFKTLQKMAAPIATKFLKLENPKSIIVIDPDEITIEGGGVLVANWKVYYCGGYDYYQTVIPLEYLFDDEWQKRAQEHIEQKRAEAAEQKRIADAKEEQERKDYEYKQYLEMKEKFEGGKIMSKEKNMNKNDEQKIIAPRFCFICGSELEEVGLGELICRNEECREMFLPYKEKEDEYQCLMHLPHEM